MGRKRQRCEQAASAGIYDLLVAIGRDCVGALRFAAEGQDPGDPNKMEYRSVSDNEIAARLASNKRLSDMQPI